LVAFPSDQRRKLERRLTVERRRQEKRGLDQRSTSDELLAALIVRFDCRGEERKDVREGRR
jgi:hypothetical protein